MKRFIINVVLIVLIVLVVRTYILPSLFCWQEGGTWEYARKVCSLGVVELPGGAEIPTLGDAFDTVRGQIDFSRLKELRLMIPDRGETDATLMKTNDALNRFITTFTDAGGMTGSAEAIAALAAVDAESGLSLIPFVVNYGGTGSFVYVGLFETIEGVPLHRDSLLLGDRVAIEAVSFTRSDGVLRAVADFKDRRPQEAMATVPSVPTRMSTGIVGTRFSEPQREVRTTHAVSYKDMIKVMTPTGGSTVNTPLTITGEARGGWFFEASFPITIVDWDGRIIGEGFATAEGEWMTNEYVPFSATISYELPPDTPYKRGAVILRKDNPSGLPENDDAVEIPVVFL